MSGRIRPGKPVNLDQLSAENPGHSWELSGDELASSLPLDQLRAAVERHTARPVTPAPPPPEPTVELRAAIRAATTLDQLKAALLGERPGQTGGNGVVGGIVGGVGGLLGGQQ